jgi:3-methyladenine DNA glycosylase Tag
MNSFSEIWARAAAMKGGEAALNAALPDQDRALNEVTDDRFLSQMTRCVFQAGFVWRIIEQKWSGFEEAFCGFEIPRLLSMPPDERSALHEDTRIVRNPQKIATVFHNAFFVMEESVNHGGFGRYLERFGPGRQLELLSELKQKGARLGGMSGQFFLRFTGYDCYILTRDVVSCLRGQGLEVKDNPTSKRQLTMIQQTFDNWHKDTGLPYAHLSRIAACSVSGTPD